MMYRRLMNSCLFLLFSSISLSAALPPLWESVEEIKSLVSHPDLGNYLDSADYIISITRKEDGFYVVTNKHILDAKYQHIPQAMPGKSSFSWSFSVEKQQEK